MQKIMFDDNLNLTKAVLQGYKTQTRRLAKTKFYVPDSYDFQTILVHFDVLTGFAGKPIFVEDDHQNIIRKIPVKDVAGGFNIVTNQHYKVDEVVAIAQRYSTVGTSVFDQTDLNSDWYKAGCGNKMFVRPEYMPYHIRITNFRIQHLQDITDDEILLEGVEKVICPGQDRYAVRIKDNSVKFFKTPRGAYEYIIDKTSGKGTWKSNPIVLVYDFELVEPHKKLNDPIWYEPCKIN